MNEAVIGSFKREKNGSLLRLVSLFDGEPVWFESEDIELEPSTEALGSLWLIPCLLSNRNLRFEQSVCKTWYENAHAVINFLKENWGTPQIELIADTYETQTPPQNAAAVCFSGGVDSLYTLYKSGSPKYLVNAEPFDVSAKFTESLKTKRNRLLKVAAEVGSIPITVRSNIPDHSSFKVHKLLDVASGILASTGHLLSPYIGSLSISPSFNMDEPAIYGCNYQLDPLWSSKSVKMLHPEPELRRRDRVSGIADWRVAQDNLFVCFNRQEALANTLHHYTLLQENYDNLLRDSQERAANHPLKKGFRAVRHVMRLLHDRNRTQPVASNNKP